MFVHYTVSSWISGKVEGCLCCLLKEVLHTQEFTTLIVNYYPGALCCILILCFSDYQDNCLFQRKPKRCISFPVKTAAFLQKCKIYLCPGCFISPAYNCFMKALEQTEVFPVRYPDFYYFFFFYVGIQYLE